MKAGAQLVEKDVLGLGTERRGLGVAVQLVSLSSWRTFLGPGTAEKLDSI